LPRKKVIFGAAFSNRPMAATEFKHGIRTRETRATDEPTTLATQKPAHNLLSRLADDMSDALRVDVLIDVVLVGFDGDGRSGIKFAAPELLRHLHLLERNQGERVTLADQSRGGELTTLVVRQRPVYRVLHAGRGLAAAVAAGVADSLQGEAKHDVAVPVSAVNGILSAEFERHGGPYRFYILHTSAGRGRRYFYTNGLSRPANDTAAPAPTSGAATGCGFQGWVGERRYAWLDLSAGPLSWGLRLRGDGVITHRSLPNVDHYVAATETALLAPALAALVRRTTAQLFAPALVMSPGGFLPPPQTPTERDGADIAGHSDGRTGRHGDGKRSRRGGRGADGSGDGGGGSSAGATQVYGLPAVERAVLVQVFAICDESPCRLNIFRIAAQLAGRLSGGGGGSSSSSGGSSGDGGGGSGMASETTAHASAATTANATAAAAASSSGYLDAQELRSWLRRFWADRNGDPSPASPAATEADKQRVVPVFVLSLATERPLLLDR
ncbi:unnamed protein product, partial [Phaeothamnion confervicola]